MLFFFIHYVRNPVTDPARVVDNQVAVSFKAKYYSLFRYGEFPSRVDSNKTVVTLYTRANKVSLTAEAHCNWGDVYASLSLVPQH